MTVTTSVSGTLTASVDAPVTLDVEASTSGVPVPVPASVPEVTLAPVAVSSTPTAELSFTSGPGVSGWGSRVDQATPSASWNIAVPTTFDRVPAVAIYLATGELVFADVVATLSNVYITFPFPVAGFVILT